MAFVCQWFAPEPVSQPTWIIEALAARGADVRVLTGIPNYPTGRVVPGYQAWRRRFEEVDGFSVQRTPLFPNHGSSALPRMLNYLSWAVSSTVFGQRLLRSADVVLVYSSPATAAMSAMRARRRGTPYVLLIQDVWPDSIFASGFLPGLAGRFARRLVNRFVDAAYRGAARIVVTSPGMRDLLVDRGVPGERVSVIFNWVPDGEVGTPPSSPGALRDRLGIPADAFVLMYAGNHGAAQGLDVAIRACAQVGPGRECHLVLVGDGVEKAALEEVAQREAQGLVHFLGSRPRSEMAELMSQADAQLVSLVSAPLFAVTTPSKLQSVLQAGQPVLVSADGDTARLVQEGGAGRTAPAGDVDVLARQLRALADLSAHELDELGRRGRNLYETRMAENIGAGLMMDTLRAAAPSRDAQPRKIRTSR